jgi:hypothetical protein
VIVYKSNTIKIMNIKKLSLYIFYGLLAYMPLHIFMSTWLGSSFGLLDFAKIFKDVVLMLGFLVILRLTPWNVLREMAASKLIGLILAFGFLNLILAVFMSTDQKAEILGLVYNTRFLVFFLYGALLTKHYKARWLINKAIKIVLMVAVPVMIFGLAQYFIISDNALTNVGYNLTNGVQPAFFIDNNMDLERVMSTLRDPNSYGAYILIIGSIAFSYLLISRSKKHRNIMIGILGLAIVNLLLTFSRSAWIASFITCAAILHFAGWSKHGFLVLTKHKFTALIILAALTVGFLPAISSNFVQNALFHTSDTSASKVSSNEARVKHYQSAVKTVAIQPAGYGPGTAGPQSLHNDVQGAKITENYYLQIAIELGLPGLFIFIGILYLTGLKLLSEGSVESAALFAALLGIILTNFFLHTWSNEAVAYTWWGLAGLIQKKKLSS